MLTMEFWGIEIKPGKPFNVEQEDGYLIHVSQVTLGDFKKVGDETVQVYVEVLGDDKQKLLLGNLSQKIPQVSLDLMLERDFVVSHECTSSSVFILGYKTLDPMNEQLDSDFDSEDPVDRFQSELEKSNANGLNDQKANPEVDESESDDEDEFNSDEMGSDDDKDDSEEEEAPIKVAPLSKKRPNGGAMNNNTVASKKAKVASQQNRLPSKRRLLKHRSFAFSPFMRSLALASTSRRKLPHPKDSQSSEDMSFDERLPSLSKKEQKEHLSDSSDEDEDSEGYVLPVDFEFFDPKPTDFHGVKLLLKNYLHDKEWDLSSFVDLILEQTTVGTMVKATDDEDEFVYAVVSVLNLARYKENKCFRELKEFLLQVCSEKNIASDLELLLEENAQDVGILVFQRAINFPLPFVPPLYDGLFDEVSWATEDEPTEELRSSFRFKSYLLVTKIYKRRNHSQRNPRPGEEDISFCKAEDEFFLKLCSWSFTFPIRSQLVNSKDMKNYQPMGLVMSVEADKIPEFRQILHSLLDE